MRRDLRIMACVFCKEPMFHKWMLTQRAAVAILCAANISNEAAAKEFILQVCGVASRNDLDTNPAAAELFHQHIRRPFLEWRDANKE